MISRILCFLGFHDWSHWRVYGGRVNSARAQVHFESRVCCSCGEEQCREVIR